MIETVAIAVVLLVGAALPVVQGLGLLLGLGLLFYAMGVR